MSVVPIVERELIVAARKPATARVRRNAALLASLTAFMVLLFGGRFGGAQGVGGALFLTLSTGAILFALGAGMFLTSDAISSERREGTLGFLFLTDLQGFDVLVGKFLACGLNAFYGIVAVLPVMATAWFLGGVTGGEFWRMALTLLNTLPLSLAVGLWVSTRTQNEAETIGRTALWIAAIALLPILLGSLLNGFSSVFFRGISNWSPLASFISARDTSYRANAVHFWESLVLVQLLGWGILIRAGLHLQRNWRQGYSPSESSATAHSQAIDSTMRESATQRTRRRLERDINPVMVIVATDPRIEQWAWICSIGGVALALLLQVFVPQPGFSVFQIPILFSWLQLPLVPLKLLLAWKACSFFAEARRDGTFELLLTTPLPDFDIIQGQLLGLRRLFGRPVLLQAVGLGMVAAWGFISERFDASSVAASLAGFAFVAVVWGFQWLVLMVDLRATAWVGFWLAMTESRPGFAFTKTAVRIILIPLILGCIPNLVLNGLQLGWARDKFRMNLRSILQGARTPWPGR